VGEAWASHIHAAVDFASDLPAGRTYEEQLALADRYRTITRGTLPWVADELDGMAAGADVDAVALFAVTVEEIWPEDEKEDAGAGEGEGGRTVEGRCSDLIAGPSKTASGHLLVAHNNDLSPKAEDELLAVEWSVTDEPITLTVGGPPWLSVGFNAAGLSFTGNQLYPNDERIGIPRQLQFRAMLRETTIGGALAIALHGERASSYNNIVADRARVANVEGSATDAEITDASGDGYLAHTNHYACERMVPREANPSYARHSAVRLRRARELLAAAPPASLTIAGLRVMLADHANTPDSLCRHPESSDGAKTVFWCIADPAQGEVTFGRGNPCESEEQTYRFPA